MTSREMKPAGRCRFERGDDFFWAFGAFGAEAGRAKRELCVYVRRRLEPAPSVGWRRRVEAVAGGTLYWVKKEDLLRT